MKTFSRALYTGIFVMGATALLLGFVRAQGESAPPRGELLTVDQAKQYMLELINRDRASKGLRPVVLDSLASRAGLKHAEEMAAYAFLSHHNREGRLPDQRYTEEGGQGVVHENVYLATNRTVAGVPLPIVKEPVIRRSDVEQMQAAYFNQIPPYDPHRSNILNPRHTHVGIAFALAGESPMRSLANAQEFVDLYVEVNPIPASAAVGAPIKVAGKVPGGLEFHSVQLSRDELPVAKVLTDLRSSKGYRTPVSFTSYYHDHHETVNRMKVSADGKFEATVRLTDDGRPGLYFVRVVVRGKDGEKFVASQRTVAVHVPPNLLKGESAVPPSPLKGESAVPVPGGVGSRP